MNKRSQNKRGRPARSDEAMLEACQVGEALIAEAKTASRLSLEALAESLQEGVNISPELMRQYARGLKAMGNGRMAALARAIERQGWAGPTTRKVLMAEERWKEYWKFAAESELPKRNQGMARAAQEMAHRRLAEAITAMADTQSPQQIILEALSALYKAGAITNPNFAGLVGNGSHWLSVTIKSSDAVTAADRGDDAGTEP